MAASALGRQAQWTSPCNTQFVLSYVLRFVAPLNETEMQTNVKIASIRQQQQLLCYAAGNGGTRGLLCCGGKASCVVGWRSGQHIHAAKNFLFARKLQLNARFLAFALRFTGFIQSIEMFREIKWDLISLFFSTKTKNIYKSNQVRLDLKMYALLKVAINIPNSWQ